METPSCPLMKAMRVPGRMVSGPRVKIAPLASEVIEALVGMAGAGHGLRILADVQDEYIGTPELQVDARLALRQAADHLGPEHARVEFGGRFWVTAEQVDVVEGEVKE